jgi:hypothetical protein
MSNPKDLALALAITATIADAAKDHKDYLRAQLVDTFNDIGAEATSADLDGERIAKVALVQPADKPYVADERAFVEYVEAHYPDDIIKTVRESMKKVILDRLVAAPDGRAVDKESGEVIDGIRFRPSTPYVTTRFDKGGREAILDALRNGKVALDLTVPAALPTGENA